ncbi:MAG: glycosyltransferase [Fibrobacter sp.]|nr:glycosyltransferase [Fibrobacter sp.]
MDTPLISVIVPIYKVEPYLRRCLDSIVNQTYTNLEIILVDDGSPDGCPAICDEYAAKDNRIVVIHKENGGLSDARNAGLDICKGEYISFVDSDDWIEKNYIEHLLTLIKNEHADIAIANHQLICTNGFIEYKGVFNNKIFHHSKFMKELIINAPIQFIVAWGKLYKREIFNDVRFPIKKIHEDQYTSYRLFYNAHKIVTTKKILYNYLKRPDSIMSQIRTIDYTPIEEEQASFFKKKSKNKLAYVLYQRLFWRSFKHCLIESKDCYKTSFYLGELFSLRKFYDIRPYILKFFYKNTHYYMQCKKIKDYLSK